MFYQEESNLKRMELTTTIWIDPVAILQPWPEEENRLHVATRPFQLKVIGKLVNHRYTKLFIRIFLVQLWVAFFGSTAIFILLTTAFVKIQEKYDPIVGHTNKSIGETIYHQFEFVLRIISSQGISCLISGFLFKNRNIKIQCFILL